MPNKNNLEAVKQATAKKAIGNANLLASDNSEWYWIVAKYQLCQT